MYLSPLKRTLAVSGALFDLHDAAYYRTPVKLTSLRRPGAASFTKIV